MPNVMNVSVSHIRRALQESYSVQEAANLSRIVCCEMLGQTTIDYYLGKDIILSSKEMQKLNGILAVCLILNRYSIYRELPVFWNAPTMLLREC